jgi:uncharacterized membrane protein YeaQ/YmgE (transglycosylase-associated protein family)
MSILATILIGLVVGIVAKFLMPGDDPGWSTTICFRHQRQSDFGIVV